MTTEFKKEYMCTPLPGVQEEKPKIRGCCRRCHKCIDDRGRIVNVDKEELTALVLSEVSAYTCYACSKPFIIRHAEVVMRKEIGMLPSIIKDCSVSFGCIGDIVGIPKKE